MSEKAREPPDNGQEQQDKRPGVFTRAVQWVISIDLARFVLKAILPKKYQGWLHPEKFSLIQVGQWMGWVQAALAAKIATSWDNVAQAAAPVLKVGKEYTSAVIEAFSKMVGWTH